MVAYERVVTVVADKSNAPYATLLALKAAGFSAGSTVQFKDGHATELNMDGVRIKNDITIARIVAQSAEKNCLMGKTCFENALIDEVLCLCEGIVDGFLVAEDVLPALTLAKDATVLGGKVTIADLALWSIVAQSEQLQKKFSSLFDRVLNDPIFVEAHNMVGKFAVAQPMKTAIKEKQKDEGKFVDLPGAEKGKVVVRFPPEASGYLHIGHAKAALLNQYYQQAFDGQLIMRFDDTNPAKENAHFEDVIKEDLALLNIIPDRWTHSSDHFELLLEMCEKLLKEGKAFVDDTDTETMRKEREDRVDSKHRTNTPEQNLSMWNEMKNGTEQGLKCCVRIKMDMKSNNGALRDPTIYRCKPEEHVRTGMKYKVYPTYDFTCPIVDSVEGVTHALRTTEYHDRDDQYYFICDALGLRKPYIWEYARLNMTNTVMSKRKLTWFVEERHVDGWDDPRLPTVRGVMRRGLTVEGLKQFIVAQGGSRSIVMMEWDKIWSFNKKVIDPVAPRYTALDESALVSVQIQPNFKEEQADVPFHPKNAEIGSKSIWRGPKLLLEQADARVMKAGDKVTFVNWGNLEIVSVQKKGEAVVSVSAKLDLDNKDYKKTLKVTWLGDVGKQSSIPVVCADYDHIINKAIVGKDEDWKQFINYDSVHFTKMIGEPALRNVRKGDIIQLQRKGFYVCDHSYQKKSAFSGQETPLLLIYIPDGHVKESATKQVESSKAVSGASTGSDRWALYGQIEKQGGVVRDLKGKDAKSDATKAAITMLLDLKKQYKEKFGEDWKPGQVAPTTAAGNSQPSNAGGEKAMKYKEIEDQGLLVRDLKGKDAKSDATKAAITKLLDLKKQYKEKFGEEWKPGQAPAPVAPASAPAAAAGNQATSYKEIEDQGLLVRDLKGKDAKSDATKAAITKLLDLKKQYKEKFGQEWKPGQAPAPPTTASAGAVNPAALYKEVEDQGLLVRDLKGKDAKSTATKEAIAKLLELKKQYKEKVGAEWKPGAAPVAAAPAVTAPASGTLYKQIEDQGLLVRELKGKDAKSAATKEAIAKLLELKKQYKESNGEDWKPGQAPVAAAPAPATTSSSANLYKQVEDQGLLVRDLKGKDPKSAATKDAITKLLALKKEYKESTGNEWKPGQAPVEQAVVAPSSSPSNVGSELYKKIEEQGLLVRELKGKDAKSDATKAAIAKLLDLKKQYKEATGIDYKPGVAPAPPAPAASQPAASAADSLAAEIAKQGDLVRQEKSKDAKSKESADAIAQLLKLKLQYKEMTGKDYQPAAPAQKSKKDDKPKAVQQKKPKKEEKPKKAVETDGKKQTKLGIDVGKYENYSEWYSQVITKGEMIEYYDVSGCYVLRPWSYAIWEEIKRWLDRRIKRLGVKNSYFPMFVSQSVLEREKDHIADFAPEVAWVTHAGSSPLADPIAIRPTSETVMYPSYKKWVQSHRDLPIKLNQWCNVVRWEFKHPTPFLRTREFLWQEGHTAYANPEDAEKEVFQVLDLYAGVYQDLLAVPVVKGRKSEKEKFAGGVFTTTVEAYVPVNGRGVQGATSHHLGQNFSKMFDISYESADSDGKRSFAWQNSWGMTTRTIGAMIMVHGDDNGLVLPPRVASVQVIILPVGLTASLPLEEKERILSAAEKIASELGAVGVRAEADLRDNYSPGWKFNHWELKGVPIRLEVGPKDIAAGQVTAVVRHDGRKLAVKRDAMVKEIPEMLETIHHEMFNKVLQIRDEHMKTVFSFDEFHTLLDEKCILLSPFCGEPDCEEKVKRDSVREDGSDGAQMGAKTLCIPIDQPTTPLGEKCIHPECTSKPKSFALFGRSY